ncbi:hypothetical protein GCM10027184_70200 [Saccharothrix stipae]
MESSNHNAFGAAATGVVSDANRSTTTNTMRFTTSAPTPKVNEFRVKRIGTRASHKCAEPEGPG